LDIVNGGTVPGGALSGDPGNKRSISLGDCPEKLGRDVVGGGFGSSNKLLRLLVTESGSNRGLGNSLIYGGVLISNIGEFPNWKSGKLSLGENPVLENPPGGVGAEWKKLSCIVTSSSLPGVELDLSEAGLGTETSVGIAGATRPADH
jgi:hypothetical protein